MTLNSRFFRRVLVRLCSFLVPSGQRSTWLEEWHAELSQGRAARVQPSGPLRHALTLRIYQMDSMRQDIAYALRGMVKKPGFSMAVILTLGLGIGANVGVFSLINTVLFRPLPLPDSDRIYLVFEQDSTGARQLASYPTFLDWHDQADVFSSLAFVRGTALSLRVGDETSFVLASFVTDEYFRVFDVRPVIGRTLSAGDFADGAAPAVIVSHDVWVNALGADTNVVGRTVRVDDVVASVVGVLPPSFALPQWTPSAGNGIWMSVHTLPSADRAALMQRDFHADSRVIGRLKDGVRIATAQSTMNSIARRLSLSYPETARRWTSVGFLPQRDMLIGDVGPRLYLLGAAVVAVLLICCVNLANLFLSRGASRVHEFAIRSAIGAGRGRVYRQLFTESLLLSASGAIMGTALALAGVRVLGTRFPGALPRMNEFSLDWRVLVFSLALTVLTAMVFTVVSARQVSDGHLADSLRLAGSSGSRSMGRRLQGGLIASQVALSMVLLIGAALLIKSLIRLSAVDPGFEPNGLVSVVIEPRLAPYRDEQAARDLYARIAESVQTVPGVDAVGLVNHAPFGGGSITSRASRQEDPRVASDETIVLYRTVSAGYFAMMGIPVVSGREFSAADLAGPQGPVIVNEAFARHWGDESPVGRPLNVLEAARDRADFGEPLLGSVIGVVGDIRHFGLDAEPTPVVYVPYTHTVWSHIVVLARTHVDPESALEAIETAVRHVEPAIPLEGLGLGARTLVSGLSNRLAPRRVNALLVAVFALIALTLATIGVYGVTSYAVASESREIGIRMALGARPGRVAGLVVSRTTKVVALGLGVGLIAGLALTRFMTGMLYQVQANDPVAFVAVSVVLLLVGTVAGYVPARRAAAIDPVTTLKE